MFTEEYQAFRALLAAKEGNSIKAQRSSKVVFQPTFFNVHSHR
jgi:hypothetical protein